MTTAAPFSNVVKAMSTCGTGHPSNYQGQSSTLNVTQDIEARIMARIAKDGVRLREFFIDFDKLRKGVVGEAAVSRRRFTLTNDVALLVQDMSRHFEHRDD